MARGARGPSRSAYRHVEGWKAVLIRLSLERTSGPASKTAVPPLSAPEGMRLRDTEKETKMFDIKRKTIEWGGRKLTLETGRMARQADGAVLATYGETMVLATAVFAKSAKAGSGLLPPDRELPGEVLRRGQDPRRLLHAAKARPIAEGDPDLAA